MWKETNPVKPEARSEVTEPLTRPIGQRLLASLLAATLTVSACGGASDGLSDSPSAVDPATIRVERSLPTASLELIDDEERSGEDASHEDASSASVVVKAPRNCSHSYRFYLRGLAPHQSENVRKVWVDGVTRRKVELKHDHPDFSHKRTHVLPHIQEIYPDRAPLRYGVRLESVNSTTAMWRFDSNIEVFSSAECTQMRRRLSEFDQGTGGIDPTMERVIRVATLITGMALTVAATAVAVPLAPEAAAAWVAGAIGCVIGSGTGIGLAALTGDISKREKAPDIAIDAIANCFASFAGAGGVVLAKQMRASRALAQAVGHDATSVIEMSAGIPGNVVRVGNATTAAPSTWFREAGRTADATLVRYSAPAP